MNRLIQRHADSLHGPVIIVDPTKSSGQKINTEHGIEIADSEMAVMEKWLWQTALKWCVRRKAATTCGTYSVTD